MEHLWRRPIDGSARKRANETGSEEDGKDAEVLGRVVDGDAFVTRSEGVLDERAEVMWQWHVSGRCEDASDCTEGTVAGVTRCVGENSNVAITMTMEGYQRFSAQRGSGPRSSHR